MTRQEAIERLEACEQAGDDTFDAQGVMTRSGDIEGAHVAADRVLCDLLAALGYGDVVAAWRAVPRWYA